MKPISKTAAHVLNRITAGMLPGTAKKIDNAPGVYMPLSVERLDERTYSLTHYYEANGDLVPDPDVQFVQDVDGNWWPMHFQNSLSFTRCVVEYDANGRPTRAYPRATRDVASFVTVWMRNLVEQQGV
jgi:hypothetical protein